MIGDESGAVKDIWAKVVGALSSGPALAEMHAQWRQELRRADELAEQNRALVTSLHGVLMALPTEATVLVSTGDRVPVSQARAADPAVWASLPHAVRAVTADQRAQTSRWSLLYRLVEKIAASVPGGTTVSSLRDGQKDALVMTSVARTAERIAAGEDIVVALVHLPPAPKPTPVPPPPAPAPAPSRAVADLVARIDAQIERMGAAARRVGRRHRRRH